ncbi:MAG: alpha/beta fold hydrolase, partial [Promethearchaeota archaeon]
DFFIKQIVEFLNLNNYDEVILIGHSLGGMIAQSITIQYPKLVKKLILISTTPSIPQSIRNKLNLVFVRMIFKLGYRKFLTNIIKRILSTKVETREFSKLYNNAIKLPKSVVLNTFKNMTSKFKPTKNIADISQPTLILYGNEDKVIPTSMIIKLGELIPKSEVVIIKDSSHRVLLVAD